MKTEWSGPAARRLKRVYGDVSLKDLYIERARSLRYEYQLPGPPFDPLLYANRLGIRVEDREMALDGMLTLNQAGEFVIYVKLAASSRRKRFTICHELSHTFFYDVITQGRDKDDFDQEEERLCDAAAAELLMPADLFLRDLEKFRAAEGITPGAIVHMCERYDVSIQAAATRLHSLLPTVACTIWKQVDFAIHLDWITPQYLQPLMLCQTGGSSVEQAMQKKGEIFVSADSYWRKGVMMRKTTSSMGFGKDQAVLSIMSAPVPTRKWIPESFGRSNARRRARSVHT